MNQTYETQLQQFPGCEPRVHVIHRKVASFYGDPMHMELYKAGQMLETLMLMDAAERDFEVGTARIEITIYDKPVGKSVEELIAQRDKLMEQANADALALTRQIEAARSIA